MTDNILEFNNQDTEANISFGFFALNIIKAKAKEIFAQNTALLCLTKSDAFLKELLNIFNGLSFYGINTGMFFDTIDSLGFSDNDKGRLLLIAQLYDYYIDIMTKNGYKLPTYKTVAIKQNTDEKSFCSIFKKFPQSEFLEFSDVQNECFYIMSKIKNAVLNDGYEYRDFAVFADKSEMRQKLFDMLKSSDVPVLGNMYNENYENLKYKISLFYKISQILEKLDCEEFSFDSVKNIRIKSKAIKEILFDSLDGYINTLVVETVSDIYALDKLGVNDNTQKPLAERLFSVILKLDESDKSALNKEISLLNRFYFEYKNKRYAEAINIVVNNKLSEFEDTELKKIIIKKVQSLNNIQKLYDEILKTQPDFEAFVELMEWLGIDKTDKDNFVTLESISFLPENGKNYKYIFIAGLTENNFPGTNNSYPFISQDANMLLVEGLKKFVKDFDCFIKTDKLYNAQRMTSLVSLTQRAIENIVLTTHSYEAKKQVQPSSVFKCAVNVYPDKYRVIKDFEQTLAENVTEAKTLSDKSFSSKVIHSADKLKINPSAISTFQNCPRKYYYKNLLNLKEPSSFSAGYGNVVHAVFEVLNRKFIDSYNKDTAIELANILFDSKNDIEKPLKAGFKQTDVDLICATADLSLAEMKDNFLNAIEDFALTGGFDEPPLSAVCEKTFSFILPEVPNVTFEGRIDALLCNKNGQYKIIDYKTGSDKTNTLEYAISEYGVSFLSKTGKAPANPENLQNLYDYQIPLYYLASQYSPELVEYKDKISELGLVYIRPKSKDGGCNEDFINAEKLEFYKDRIIQNLKETVIDKILNETEFKKSKGFNCENCAFKFLCDTEDDYE